MPDRSLAGGFSDPPVNAARVFRAALSAMARPGRIEVVGGAQAPAPVSPAAAALLLTLCDTETPLYLAPGHDGEAVREWIAFHVGAPVVAPPEAQFALGRWAALRPVTGFAPGTPDYPDRSATLIVELDTVRPGGVRLTGPGIGGEATLSLPEVEAFQANRARFPLGLDFYFTAADRLAGLPRSTRVEAA